MGLVIESGNIGGIPQFKINTEDECLSVENVINELNKWYSRYNLQPKYVMASTNRDLLNYQTLEEIGWGREVVNINARVPVLGGKGGFGANLRATKGRSGRQPKRDTKDSKTYYKDLKTGVKTKDINRLKKAYEIMLRQENQSAEDKERTKQKKEKLAKAISYYESVLNGSVVSNERFQDTEFLDELDGVIMDLRSSMNSALELDSEGSESDWESSDDEQLEPKEGSSKDQAQPLKTKPKFASFFDEDEDEQE